MKFGGLFMGVASITYFDQDNGCDGANEEYLCLEINLPVILKLYCA